MIFQKAQFLEFKVTRGKHETSITTTKKKRASYPGLLTKWTGP